MKWDNGSGVRERLALLAELGPSLAEHSWGYHPSRDFWYWCGPKDAHPKMSSPLAGNVRQEGSDSLALIEQRWGLDRAAAMARIGYPVEVAR